MAIKKNGWIARMADRGELTLEELATVCRITKDCLKCECIEYCSSYAQFMNRIQPKWWLSLKEEKKYELPDLHLTKETFKLRRRQQNNEVE